MNNMVAGIGDVILRYPELLNEITDEDRALLDTLPDNLVAVHPFASAPNKALPHPEALRDSLFNARIPFVILGCETLPPIAGERLPPRLNLQLAVLRRAKKFIGSLSCFNCAAQVFRVPSFVIVNRSIKEPFVYELMEQNGAQVRAWNDGSAYIWSIYKDAVEWAAKS